MKNAYRIVRPVVLLLGLVILFPDSNWASDNAHGIRAGGVVVYPSMEYQAKFDDNILEVESNKVSSWVSVMSPAIKLKVDDRVNEYNAAYRFSKGVYHSSRADDYIDHFVALSAHNAFSSRLQTDLSFDYSKTHDDRGTTFAGTALAIRNSPDRYSEYALKGKIGYGLPTATGRIELTGEYSNRQYSNNRTVTILRDMNTGDISATFFYRIMPKTSMLFEMQYKKFDYKLLTATIDLDSDEQNYYTGLRWDAMAKMSGSVRIGYQNKDFNKITVNDHSGFGWQTDITWSPATYSVLHLLSASQPEETDSTIGTYIKATYVKLSWQHEWSWRVSHTIVAEYRRDAYVDDPQNRRDLGYKGDIRLDYQLFPWLLIGVSYDYSQRHSNVAGVNFKRNVLSLTLKGYL